MNGEWHRTAADKTIPDPLNGEPFISYPDIKPEETQPFIDSLRAVPKTGLHNPLKNPERYLLYGAISARMAEEMRKPEVPPATPPPPLPSPAGLCSCISARGLVQPGACTGGLSSCRTSSVGPRQGAPSWPPGSLLPRVSAIRRGSISHHRSVILRPCACTVT